MLRLAQSIQLILSTINIFIIIPPLGYSTSFQVVFFFFSLHLE